MGVYTARALSYAGVEYDILEHELTPTQIVDFDTYVQSNGIAIMEGVKIQSRYRNIIAKVVQHSSLVCCSR